MPAPAAGPRLDPIRFGATLAAVTAPIVFLAAALLGMDDGDFETVFLRAAAITVAVAVAAFGIGAALVLHLNRHRSS